MLNPLALAALAVAFADPSPGPAVAIRLERPDVQLERLIGLFRGSRAPDPASALAAWKRGREGAAGLGKAQEAALAALNPRMVGELATLDGAGFLLDFAPAEGSPQWAFVVPHDDGTFAAFATAMTLTDGASEPSEPGTTVDRLGPPGSALLSRAGEAVIIGGSRDGLSRGSWFLKERREIERGAAHARDQAPRLKDPLEGLSEIAFDVDPRGLLRSRSLGIKRLGEVMLGFGWHQAHGTARLHDEILSVNVKSEPDAAPPSLILDPRWQDDLPADASMVFSTALDPRPEAWDRLFLAADRIEKADPARAKLAPIRIRLNLLAGAARLDPERDLWPRLVGVSGFLLGEVARPRAIALGLHAKDDASAATLRDRFLPRLVNQLHLGPAPADLEPQDRTRVAVLAGRPISILKGSDSTAWIAWGDEGIDAILESRKEPRRSAVASPNTEAPGARLALVWPSRLGLAASGEPLAEALASMPPIEWRGENSRGIVSDTLVCRGLRPAIHRFLELIPQEPAPEPGR